VSDYKPSETAPSNNGSFDERSIEMLCRVNALRAEVGKKPYKFDKRLIDAAQKHSEDQAAQKQMSHTGSKIPYFLDRIKAAGYPAKDGSENVAWNQRTVAWVVDSWRKSSGHYRAIIGDYECFGWGEKNFYWTQTFGS
ncbi:transmembrane protein, partial [Neoconidiobolus thromboides FSU 785]